jgi:hypothetical protein
LGPRGVGPATKQAATVAMAEASKAARMRAAAMLVVDMRELYTRLDGSVIFRSDTSNRQPMAHVVQPSAIREASPCT